MRRIAVLTGVLSGLLLQPMTVAADGRDDGDRGASRTGRCGSSTATGTRSPSSTPPPVPCWRGGRREPTPMRSPSPSRVDKAYITNETAGTISILSTRTLDRSPEIVLGPRPHHVEASRDGAEIVVGLVGTNAVAVIDGQTDQVRRGTPPARTRRRPPTARTCEATRSTSPTRVAERSPPSTPNRRHRDSSSEGSSSRARCCPTHTTAGCTCPLGARGRSR